MVLIQKIFQSFLKMCKTLISRKQLINTQLSKNIKQISLTLFKSVNTILQSKFSIKYLQTIEGYSKQRQKIFKEQTDLVQNKISKSLRQMYNLWNFSSLKRFVNL
ncbi:hypothetical protein TTHERM_000556675 (macronuclear) [Tetrahymena thermophila SB210]|uniref:Uncharacterized protein n=1 Tax=Tetrahymena thermophila (strain SB210) TaxID=312017 RepID=W7X0P8_TETTS|nr:hypothetical protein TTHERM_000556675 [Tetrahymena thermophila SB210]EWS72735.1 hypothetical protein TTHERM_000556675 [Tetrahymena thermophila SB210]|eukprot:XP_012654713.1 hypothetical protein TTHERM_000556675 [Tetrahymena thermophila SB210]